MSSQKFKSNSYYVGGRLRSATKTIFGDITSKGIKVLISYCSICKRRKSMTVSNNTLKADGKKGLNVQKDGKKRIK